MKNGIKFKVISNYIGDKYSSEKYDIFFFRGVVDIYEPDEHIHPIVRLENDELLDEWRIEIIN